VNTNPPSTRAKSAACGVPRLLRGLTILAVAVYRGSQAKVFPQGRGLGKGRGQPAIVLQTVKVHQRRKPQIERNTVILRLCMAPLPLPAMLGCAGSYWSPGLMRDNCHRGRDHWGGAS
jgi:hypothetical protein